MASQEDKKRVTSVIEARASDLALIAATIFNHPELNFQEKIAHECLTNFLDKSGFIVERHLVLDTAFRATFCSKTEHGK